MKYIFFISLMLKSHEKCDKRADRLCTKDSESVYFKMATINYDFYIRTCRLYRSTCFSFSEARTLVSFTRRFQFLPLPTSFWLSSLRNTDIVNIYIFLRAGVIYLMLQVNQIRGVMFMTVEHTLITICTKNNIFFVRLIEDI